jgi:hypothetical protein
MKYPGGKNHGSSYPRIINQIPPHHTYIEPFAGSAAIRRLMRPSPRSILIDLDPGALGRLTEVVPPNTELLHTDALAWLERDPLCLPAARGRGMDFLRHGSGVQWQVQPVKTHWTPERCLEKSRAEGPHILPISRFSKKPHGALGPALARDRGGRPELGGGVRLAQGTHRFPPFFGRKHGNQTQHGHRLPAFLPAIVPRRFRR